MRVLTGLIALAVIGTASIANAQWFDKPWQFHIGIVNPTGDVADNGDADNGMMFGFDYALRPMGESSYSFLGARWWRAEATDPFAYLNVGFHYGMQWNFNRERGSSGGLYAKAALGVYTGGFKTDNDLFGSVDLGGLFGLGWESTGPMMWGLELSLYIMPEIGNDDNRGWTLAFTFRP